MPTDPREIAAYIDGLGLCAVSIVTRDQTGRPIKIRTGQPGTPPVFQVFCETDNKAVALVCAARAAVAKTVPALPYSWLDCSAEHAAEVIRATADQEQIQVETQDSIQAHAENAVAIFNLQFDNMRTTGGLNSVNKSYHEYRIKETSEGRNAQNYAAWMKNYKIRLIRAAATASKRRF